MTADVSPEIGQRVQLGDLVVNYHDLGQGDPVMLIHGSGPGVSSWVNWSKVAPVLSQRFRLIMPDMIGFGYTEAPESRFDLDAWVGEVIDLADHLGIERFKLIGNSFGGSLALHVARRHPDRVSRAVLMGPGVRRPISAGLDAVWGYEPSVENMTHLVKNVFVADPDSVADELGAMRYRASIRPTVQERYAALFPAPRQRWLDALGMSDEELATIETPILIIQGRQDKVLPKEGAIELERKLPRANLLIVDHAGHWVQIEQTDVFCEAATFFLSAG